MFKRTLYLFFGILLSITSGSVFIYPTYSYYIKNKFNFSLREINLYATFINIGVWVGFGMGLIYDTCGSKLSTMITLFILPGSLVVLYKFIQSSSISLIWFLLIALIMGQGSSLAYTNALSTNVKNFSKRNSSNIVGLIISNSAIAPSIFASIKSSFSSMSITSYIAFVIYYVLIVVVLCLFWFDEYEETSSDIFRNKIFDDFKQRCLIYLFSYSNFLALFIFICILLFNHIFGTQIPAFIVFILLHITFIVFIILENQKKFDNWLNLRFNRTHKGINSNSNIGNNRTHIIGRSVEVLQPNEKSENKNLKKVKEFSIKEVKDDINDNYKGYTEVENITRIKDKFDLKFYNKEDKNYDNKKDHSLDININRSIGKHNLENNQNINKIGEYNKEANGRISIDSNNEENKNKEEIKKEEEIKKMEDNKKEEDNKEDENNKEEEKKEEKKEDEKDNNINNENNENNNIIKEKNEDTSLEKSIKNINSIQKKDDEENQINNSGDGTIKENNKNQDNNEDIDNGAKKTIQNNDNIVNNKEEEKEEKNEKEKEEKKENTENLGEPPLNYPRFSTNSTNNNINENNIQNNYPKFSISSDNENPYKEKEEEKEKFSIARKSEGKKEEEININKNRDSKLTEAKYPIYDKNLINKNSFDSDDENKKEEKNKNQILNQDQKNKNVLHSPPPMSPPYPYQNSIEETNANILNTHTSFNSLNNSSNIYSSDEKEDDNMENYSRCVFLLTLFRRPQIMILFIVLILTMGSMISNVNNIKYIVVSIDPSKDIASTSLDKYPLLYFAFNSLTRIVLGSASNQLMGTDEAFTILLSITIIGLISQIFGFFMTKFFVYLSISFAGMTHGGIMTFVPLYCRYYFSLKNLGTVLGFLTTGNAIGSVIIATLIFPIFYHKYATYNNNKEEICHNTKCFRFSYGLNCLFLLVAIFLSFHLYAEDKKKKIKRRNELKNKIRNTSISCYNDNLDTSTQTF